MLPDSEIPLEKSRGRGFAAYSCLIRNEKVPKYQYHLCCGILLAMCGLMTASAPKTKTRPCAGSRRRQHQVRRISADLGGVASPAAEQPVTAEVW
jgi:hypothetical protein